MTTRRSLWRRGIAAIAGLSFLLCPIAPAQTPAWSPGAPAGAGRSSIPPISDPLASAHPAAPEPPPPPIGEAGAEVDGARLRLSAASTSIEVGEPLRLRLEVELPPGVEARFENLASAARGTLGSFEVRSARVAAPETRNPRRRVQELEVTTFESGVVELPPVAVRLVGPDGAETSASVGPLRIEVRSLIGDADPLEALRPVKDAVDIPLPRDWRMVAAVAGAVLVLLALAFVAWRFLRRERMVPEIPPHEAARAELARLRAEALPESGRVLEFYVRLSDIVRRYVERRFAIRAPELTTKEFLDAAGHHPSVREEHRILLGGFLRSADRVKFAAERPGTRECDAAFEAAEAFVNESAPQPVEGARGPAPGAGADAASWTRPMAPTRGRVRT